MSLYDVPLPQIDATRLELLRENQVAESRTLDYKERVPKGEDLWEDVTAFANTAGGDLLCGVRERLDVNGQRTGEPDSIVGLPGPLTVDQLILGVEHSLRDVIKPRVMGIKYHTILRGAEPPCLLIRVPRSPLGPHMVVQKSVGYFYGRGARGNFPLDWGQIRDAFVEAHGAQERLARFRRERVIRLLAGETPIPTAEGAKIIFHALPLSSVDVWATFQTLDVIPHVLDGMNPLDASVSASMSWRYNLDGFVLHTARSELERQTYTQCFRDGGLEGFGPLSRDAKGRGLYGQHIERAIVRAVAQYQKLWARLGLTGQTMMLALTLSEVGGVKLLGPSGQPLDRDEVFEHNVTLIPELVVQDVSIQPARLLRPLFDLMWNAGGWKESPFYDQAGEWTGGLK